MKKAVLIFGLVAMAFSIQAQSFGIQAGMNFATGDLESVSDIKGISGIRIGPIVQFPIGPVVEIHSGALYSQQGFELPTSKTTIDYLDVPLALALSFDLGGLGAFIKAGPVFGIGIGGKFADDTGSTDLSFGSGDDEISVVEIGGEFGAGVKLGTLQISATYDQGFSDISNLDSESWKNKVFHVALSFVIGK